MNNQKLEIKREGEKFMVGRKIFYNEVAARIYIEEKESPKAPMSTATKAFIFFTLMIALLILIFGGPDFNSLSGGRYSDAFIEGSIKGALLTPIIAFIFWAPKKLKDIFHNRKLKNEANENAYEEALIEIEENKIVKKTWAKAFAMSGGDESKTKAEYIRIRAKEISAN